GTVVGNVEVAIVCEAQTNGRGEFGSGSVHGKRFAIPADNAVSVLLGRVERAVGAEGEPSGFIDAGEGAEERAGSGIARARENENAVSVVGGGINVAIGAEAEAFEVGGAGFLRISGQVAGRESGAGGGTRGGVEPLDHSRL